MKITTQSQGFEMSSNIDRFVRESVTAALRRFVENVVSVDVYLKDTNGPKGGIDKHAVIRVRLVARQEVAVETRHEHLLAAVKSGSSRVRRAVRRHLRKSRRIERKRLRELPADSRLPTVTAG